MKLRMLVKLLVLGGISVVLVILLAAIGGQVGAKVGRRLPPFALRVFIVVVGSLAIVQLLLR